MNRDYLPPEGFYDRVARYYDAENENMVEDLEFYSAIAESGVQVDDLPMLDVGCGTGRVMLHLAAEGHEVHGVDISQAMIERGHRKLAGRADLRDRATFLLGNAATYNYPTPYRMILIPYNGFMHFHSTNEQIAILTHLAASLVDGGLIVFDLPNAGDEFATADDNALTFERMFLEYESGNMVMQQSISHLNRTAQMQYVTWIYDEVGAGGELRRTVAPLALRYIFPSELDLLLHVCGLERAARYGDYDESPFEEGCPRLLVVARKRRA